MRNLEEIRQEIDSIDTRLIDLFVRRMKAVEDVAEAKKAKGTRVLDPARERQVLARAAEAAGEEYGDEARLLMSTLMAMSRGRQNGRLAAGGAFQQELLRATRETPARIASNSIIACPGAEGGYSQQAASMLVRDPRLLYFKTFDDVFNAVEDGLCEYGVLPVENSAAGSVVQVYDLMARHVFRIVRACKLRIKHVLLARPGVKIGDVKEIWSHPHALAQCKRFLRTLPTVRTIPALNTAAAARDLADTDRTDVAVIASRNCAELYGLDVLNEDISDTASNFTRFICISRKTEIFPDADKFTLQVSLSHRAGALADVLLKFAAAGINLTKLESRPVPGTDFEFRFILDFEALPNDMKAVSLIAGLADDPDVEHFNFLGAYREV